MSDSFQHEIPKGRVNLTVDIKTNGASKTIELPHKTLVIGDFSNGKSKGVLQEREKLAVSKFTRDSVMKSLSPEIHIALSNDTPVNLTFEKLDDFHPESIVEQVPQLKKMLAMRNLLKELRSNLVDNHEFKTKLNQILSDENAKNTVKQQIESVVKLMEQEG